MKKFDIVGSIILTLILWAICAIFHLGFWGSLLLVIFSFVILNNRGKCIGYWNGFKDLFSRKYNRVERVEVKSSYKYMKIDEED